MKLRVVCSDVCLEKDRKIMLQHIHLSLTSGICYLVGPNGSGKSSLLRLLTSAAQPTSGTIRYYEDFDDSPFAEREIGRHEIRSRIGYLPQRFDGYGHMSVERYIRHQYLQKGLPVNLMKTYVQTQLKETDLWDLRKTRLARLSGGQKQRVGILQSMLGNPDLCLLDEPFESLDVTEAIIFRHRLQQLAVSGIVVISTHRLEWIGHHPDDLVIELDHGRIASIRSCNQE